MIRRLQFLGLMAAAWVIIFQFARLLFYFYQYLENNRHPLSTLLLSSWHGLRMDISFTSYLLLLPTLLISTTAVHWAWYAKFAKKYFLGVSVIISLIVTFDLEVYRSWGFRLDTTPIRYLADPKEAYASISASPLLLLVLILLSCTIFLIFINSFILDRYHKAWKETNKWLTPLLFLLLTGGLIIPIRGGLQLAPMNQSAVYFSSNSYANQLAVNAGWNFFSSLINDTGRTDNPYESMSKKEANHLIEVLQARNSSLSYQIKSDSATNVILIIWESFTSKVVASLGGVPNITPRFDSLRKEGLFFTNIYASGDRSDKGLIALLSGYPAQPITSIITIPSKTATLPSLPEFLKTKSYSTSFYYGGETEFANIKSYLLQQGFDHIVDKGSFQAEDMNSKWGAHDHVVFERLLFDLDHQSTPFFSTLFTLSSHEPFEVPTETVINGNSNENKFMNAHHYTDACLGTFIDRAKTKHWWKNTLLVIIADHGHPLPHLSESKSDQFHIPMLWLGGVIKNQGTRIDTLGSQIDLVSTILGQLNYQSNDFQWSNNLFGMTRTPFAFYTFNDGFGWITPKGNLVYDNIGKSVTEKNGTVQVGDKQLGLAYLQTLFDDFLSR